MQDKQQYQEAFAAAYERLNESQKRAVNHTEGPVLVIAGPGTGKTQILAARVGHILNTTDAKPENILCLTFTDAGTIAMRQRLLKFIGPDAYKVDIFTFHAFCNRVIKDNMEHFGMRALDSITELEQIELLQKLIDGFEKDNALKRWTGEIYYETDRLRRLFSIMKQENWTPELIKTKVNEYIEDLPNREQYQYKRANSKKNIKVGDPKQAEIDSEIEKMSKLVAAAEAFPKYAELMKQKGRYDYDDMLLLVLNKFKEDENLLLQYREQYQYFLVDEYQDTNGAQNEILNLLVDYWDEPNVFVVGDDDQSIYRFQGANVANILDFNQRYKPEVILMTQNYRSSQNILDLSGILIASNEERLVNQIPDLSKVLEANHQEFAHSHVKPQIRAYYNQSHETVGIAQEIEALKAKGVNLGEVAVLYRNHRQAEDLTRYLESKGIAVNIKRRTNVLDTPFIRKILVILSYLRGEAEMPYSKEDLLFEILHFDFYQADPLDIARIALDIRNKKDNDSKWRDTISQLPVKQQGNLFEGGGSHTNKVLRDISQNLESWIKESHNTTLQVLFEKIITEGGILNYVMTHPLKFSLMQELSTFFDFIKEESVKDPEIRLAGFLRTIKLMQENKIELSIQQTLFTEGGVNFVTAHSSKGLEFEYVYIIGATSKAWDKPGRSSTYTFPDNLVTSIAEADISEEQRRLFYVALTRAKHHLILSYYELDNNGKEQEASRFIEELRDTEHVTIEHINLPNSALLEYNMQIMQEERLPDLQMVEEAYLRRILDKYSLSVTHLNTYLKCPVSFYYQQMLRIPIAKNQYMAFGSAVHFALERLFRSMQTDGDTFPLVDQLVKDFDWYMFRHKDSFTKEEFDQRLEFGRKILPEYYNEYVKDWNKVVAVERNLRAVVDGIQINGKLDKIEFDGRDANVVDYKTGKWSYRKKKYFKTPTDAPKDPEAPTFEEQYGGDYWRQAVFYKILVDNETTKSWNVVSTEFDFVEPYETNPSKFHKEKVLITEDDMAIVREQIQTVYARIMNLEFDEGCNEPDCQWCSFQRNNFELSTDSPEEDLEFEDSLPEVPDDIGETV